MTILKYLSEIVSNHAFAALSSQVINIGRQSLFNGATQPFCAVFINREDFSIGIVNTHQALRVLEETAKTFFALLNKAGLFVNFGDIMPDRIEHARIPFQLYVPLNPDHLRGFRHKAAGKVYNRNSTPNCLDRPPGPGIIVGVYKVEDAVALYFLLAPA